MTHLASAFVVIAIELTQAALLPPTCQSDSTAAAAVRAVADGIISADNARDLNRVRGFYAPDAVLMPLNEAPVRGWPAIRPRYESLFDGFEPAIVGHIDEVCASGRIAYVRGRNTGQMRGRGSNQSRALNDVYLMLLGLDAASRWRITHLIWHSAGPGSP